MKLTESSPSFLSFLALTMCSISHFHNKLAFSGRRSWSSEKFKIFRQALK
jgi:hypothetical protein